MTHKKDIEKWREDIKLRAKVLYKKIHHIKPLYGQDPVVPKQEEITQAFALCLVDIARYCEDNYISAKNIDTVKLMAFAIPHLLSIRNYALRLDIYADACLLVIHGDGSIPSDFKRFSNTTNVMKHLCLRFPSQHLVAYGYLKGYQEALEINHC